MKRGRPVLSEGFAWVAFRWHFEQGVLALLRELVDDDRHTVVMVTHDPVAAAHADRVILLADGRLAGMLDAPSADEVAEQLAHLGD